MNTTTYARPIDPNAARIERKLRARGIDPTKRVAKPDAAKEIPSLTEQDAELERMLLEEYGETPVIPKATAEATIGDEAVTETPVTEPVNSETENPSNTPVLETAAEVPETQPTATTVAEAKPDTAEHKPSAPPKAMLNHAITVVVSDGFAELFKRRAKVLKAGTRKERDTKVLTLTQGNKQTVQIVARDGWVMKTDNLAGCIVALQPMSTTGDGIRRYAIDATGRTFVEGVLAAHSWPESEVTFENTIARNGSYTVSALKLKAETKFTVAGTQYLVTDLNNIEKVASKPTEPKSADLAPQGENNEPERELAPPQPELNATAAQDKPAPQPEKQPQPEQQYSNNGDQRDRTVTPPPSFKAKAKGQRKQAKRPKLTQRERELEKMTKALVTAFPNLTAQVKLPKELFLLSPSHIPTCPASEAFRLMAKAEETKEALSAEMKMIATAAMKIVDALQTIVDAAADANEHTIMAISDLVGNAYTYVNLDPATKRSAESASRRKLMSRLQAIFNGHREAELHFFTGHNHGFTPCDGEEEGSAFG